MGKSAIGGIIYMGKSAIGEMDLHHPSTGSNR